MLTRHGRSNVTWIDLESPTREELDGVMEEFGIDRRIEEEIITPTPYPLVVVAHTYVYLILHFPTSDPEGGARSQEIDFIVGKDFIITVRYEVIASIYDLHRIFEAEELLSGSRSPIETADLLARLMQRLYGAITDQTELSIRSLERIEEGIFGGRQREAVYELSLVGRSLLRFDTILDRHKEPLRSFLDELTSAAFFGRKFRTRIPQILAERDHAADVVAAQRAVLRELRITNDSLLSTNQNAIMTRLTIMTFAAFPLTVIAGIFGMNADNMPFIDSPHAFWIILGIMALSVTLFLSFFKLKRWI